MRVEKSGGCVSLLMLDIDHFKQINDKYGHIIGDLVIKQAAGCIKRASGKNAIVGRYGGEEFIVLLPGLKGENAFAVAESIRRCVEETKFKTEEAQVRITVSIGIATACGKIKFTAKQIINEADKALYQAKKSGRNKIVL